MQLGCGGALVLNRVSTSNATAGGGAYINNVSALGMYENEWTSNTANVGSGAVDLQTVSNATIANDTFTTYILPPPSPPLLPPSSTPQPLLHPVKN